MISGPLLRPMDHLTQAGVFEKSDVQPSRVLKNIPRDLEIDIVVQTLCEEPLRQRVDRFEKRQHKPQQQPWDYRLNALRALARIADDRVDQAAREPYDASRQDALQQARPQQTQGQNGIRRPDELCRPPGVDAEPLYVCAGDIHSSFYARPMNTVRPTG